MSRERIILRKFDSLPLEEQTVDVQKQTEIVLAWELYEQGLSKSAIARRLGRHRETIIEWIKAIEQQGLTAFVEASQQACKVPRPARQVDALVKRHIWAVREREHDCCGQKIAYFWSVNTASG